MNTNSAQVLHPPAPFPTHPSSGASHSRRFQNQTAMPAATPARRLPARSAPTASGTFATVPALPSSESAAAWQAARRRHLPFKPALALALATLVVLPTLRADSVRAYRGREVIPTYPWWPPVPHPYFRATDGRNIYPYPMLDNLSRTREPHTWQTVTLENQYLRVTFLPALGGRIHEVRDKLDGTEMFYVNHVVKPGLIGECGAWVSGGVEWNSGPAGHTVSAVQPVEVQILPPGRDGSRSVAIGETERIYRTRWTVVVTLRPGRSFLEERIRIYNPNRVPRPYYFWNCTAVPNTPGFRFIYPMTLGSDHSGKHFYTWPISNGRDLSRGTTYQDASSIFAYRCNQNFFGSYDEGTDHGVVAFANHYLLPGKKAWTWGHGSYGTMHEMDLTDHDGPYNEVQTGPLPTQADVGRLDPGEAVSWKEWWYPIHGIGPFTFATRDVAVHAAWRAGKLHLDLIGTGTWDSVHVVAKKNGKSLATARCRLSPASPTRLTLAVAPEQKPVVVTLKNKKHILAQFEVPLALPVRTPPKPAPKAATKSPSQWVAAGRQAYLFARFPEARQDFARALEGDPHSVGAHIGLANLQLDSDPAEAAKEARAALAVAPDSGPAHLVLAAAECRLDQQTAALDQAWSASLDSATATPARAFVGELLICRGAWADAARALSAAGPWRTDPVARDELAFAQLQQGRAKAARHLATGTLATSPLDAFARSILWLAHTADSNWPLEPLLQGDDQERLDLTAQYSRLGQKKIALEILESVSATTAETNPLIDYWKAYLAYDLGQTEKARAARNAAAHLSPAAVFPHRWETVAVLRWALRQNPRDGHAALYLGHLLFALGRQAEGRQMWQRAADLGTAPAIAYRALAMARQRLDQDLPGALALLKKANQADPADPIVARDLASLLMRQADQLDHPAERNARIRQARQILEGAFKAGKTRSDCVALLAQADNELGDYAATARLLDSVRITIWEGAQQVHNLFEQAHLALGRAALEQGHPAKALAEFNRALEYPKNLATGKLESTSEADIHYLRGRALAVLGRPEAARKAWQEAVAQPHSNDPKKEAARKEAQAALGKQSGKL